MISIVTLHLKETAKGFNQSMQLLLLFKNATLHTCLKVSKERFDTSQSCRENVSWADETNLESFGKNVQYYVRKLHSNMKNISVGVGIRGWVGWGGGCPASGPRLNVISGEINSQVCAG